MQLICQLEKSILLNRFDNNWSLFNNILKCSAHTLKMFLLSFVFRFESN